MSNRKPPETEAELLATLANLFDEVEVESDEEAEQILRAAGHDIEAFKREIRDVVAEARATSPMNWRNKRTAIARAKAKATAARRQWTTRAEIEAAIQNVLAHLSPAEPVVAHFRNFAEMTDEDLASWLDELTFLVELDAHQESEARDVS